MAEIIDTYESALFLGAMVNTLEKTFPFVAVISQNDISRYNRATYVLVAAKNKIDVGGIYKGFDIGKTAWYLNEQEIAYLLKKSNSKVLTDDYAPVENLTAPVVRHVEKQIKALSEQIEKNAREGNVRKTIQKLKALSRADPIMGIREYIIAANILTEAGKNKQALAVYEDALDSFMPGQYEVRMLVLRHSYAMLLRKEGRENDALEQLDIVTKSCRQLIDKNPEKDELQTIMGRALFDKQEFAKAAEHLRKALDKQPDNIDNCIYLIQALELSSRREDAIRAAQDEIEYLTAAGHEKDAEQINRLLQQIQSRNTHLLQDKK